MIVGKWGTSLPLERRVNQTSLTSLNGSQKAASLLLNQKERTFGITARVQHFDQPPTKRICYFESGICFAWQVSKRGITLQYRHEE